MELVQTTSYEIKPAFSSLFSNFIDYLQASDATKQTYIREIKQFMKYLAINEISEPQRIDIINYVKYLNDKGLKPTTVQNYIIAVRQLFNWLEVEYQHRNIAKGIKGAKISRNHKKDNFSMKQVASILRTIDRSIETGARDYAIILLIVTTAMRTVEIHRADIDDIRHIDGKTYLMVQGKGHSEKDTLVTLTEVTYKAIQQYLAFRHAPKTNEPLFTSTSNYSRGSRIATRTISGLLKARFKDAGIDSPRLTAHSLRHTGITEAYKAIKSVGIADPLSEVQKYARHASPATTQIYIHEEEQKNNLGASLVGAVLDNALSDIA
ncbi:TPA: tyrosine-type recombinase/integrase [Streptococcus suis]